MDVLKGVVKIVLAIIALGTGGELGKKGIENLKKGCSAQNNNTNSSK